MGSIGARVSSVVFLALNATAAAAAAGDPAGPPRWLEDIGDRVVVDAATAPDGGIAVLLGACAAGRCDLEVQRYDRDGLPTGGRVAVETVEETSLPRGYASVAIDGAGNLVVGLPDKVRGHVVCIPENGARTQHAIRGGYAEGTFVQDLVIAGGGNFVVGWTQEAVPEGLYHFEALRTRTFKVETCAPVNAARTLERHLEYRGSRPLSDIRDLNLAASPDGWLAAAWVSRDRNSVTQLKLKTYQPNGQESGGTRAVGVIVPGTSGDVGIANDGRTVAAFHPPGSGAPGRAAIRRYSALGVESSPEAVDTAALPGEADVHIGVDAIGDFVAGWTSFPGAADSVAALRRFDATSGTLGDATPVTADAGHFVLYDVLQRGDGGSTVLYVEYFPDDVAPRYYLRRYE